MKVNWKEEKEKLEELINSGASYLQIGEMYGVSFNAVKKAARKLGIPLKPRRKISDKEHFNKGRKRVIRVCANCGKELSRNGTYQKYCSVKCQHEYQYKQRVKQWQENPGAFNSEYMPSFIRQYMLIKSECRCENCGWGEKNKYTDTIPLEIHHIDGDCTNNIEKNLQVLCPNCHSLTKTYGSLNKSSKRYKLKEYKTNISTERVVKLINSIDDEEKKKEIICLLQNKSNPDKSPI